MCSDPIHQNSKLVEALKEKGLKVLDGYIEGRSKKIEVRNSTVAGTGWFALQDISEGEIVYLPRQNPGTLIFSF
jgi:hypothetical protein